MRAEDQFAQTLLRLLRKRGLILRVERSEGVEPILHVSPKERVSIFMRQAIPRVKEQLIALLASEGVGFCTGADGVVWKQQLVRCPHCQACDWGVIGIEKNEGPEHEIWGCQTCGIIPEEIERELAHTENMRLVAMQKSV